MRFRTLAIAALAGLLAPAAPAAAATFTVTKPGDTADGTCNADCSLREAITAARNSAGADAVVLPAGTFAITRASTGDNNNVNGNLNINSSVTITGAGVGATTIDGNGHAIANLYGGPEDAVTIRDLTFANAGEDGFGGEYGGLWAANGGVLTLERVVFQGGVGPAVRLTSGSRLVARQIRVSGMGPVSEDDGAALHVVAGTTATVDGALFAGNSVSGATNGAAVASAGTTTIRNATFASNAATGTGGGGALDVSAGATVLESSTLAGNVAGGGGGELRRTGGTLTVRNTVVDDAAAGACSGTIVSLGHNLTAGTCGGLTGGSDVSGTDARLGPLAANDSPLPWLTTFAPLAGSPLVEAGDNAGCAGTDPRGFPRVSGPSCDIGAVEVQHPSLRVTASAAPATVAPGGAVLHTVTVTQTGPAPAPGVTLTSTVAPGGAGTPSSGACDGGGSTPLTCALGTLAAGQSATVTVPVTAPATPGTVAVGFRAAGTLSDEDPSDDAATSSFTVAAPAGGGGTPPQVTPPADRTAPVLSRLRVRGRTLQLTLGEAAVVRTDVRLRRPGRRSDGRCRATARKGKRCTVVTTLRTATRSLAAGARTVALTGKRGKRLGRGRYAVRVSAVDAAGNRSAPVEVRFRIR